MIRVLLKLTAIFVLAAAGVHFGYSQLENRLLSEVCKPLRGGKTTQPEKKAARQATSAGSEPPAAEEKDFQVIVRRNIFQPVAAVAKTTEEAAPPPPTSLNLDLVGTVTGLEKGSWAIIADKAKKQQLVKPGGKIKGTEAVVKAVGWSSVTLEVNGRTEILEMPKPKPGKPRRSGGQAGRDVNRIELPDMNSNPEPPPLPDAAEAPAPPVLRPHRRINLPELPASEMEPPVLPGVELPGLQDEPPQAEMPELPEINEMPQPEIDHGPPVELPPAE